MTNFEVCFCEHFDPHIFFSDFEDAEGFVILHITLLFFRQLLLYHLPHLHNQLEDAGVAPVVYATPWFITLFAYKNPLHVTMRLWHEYIRRGDPTFVPFLAVALMELEKQAFLNAEEDDLNSAVDRTRITSLEKLRDVWKAAENLHSRTPKSFTFRMSKVLTQVRQQLRKLEGNSKFSLSEFFQNRRLVFPTCSFHLKYLGHFFETCFHLGKTLGTPGLRASLLALSKNDAWLCWLGRPSHNMSASLCNAMIFFAFFVICFCDY